jgi:hypothetical protein
MLMKQNTSGSRLSLASFRMALDNLAAGATAPAKVFVEGLKAVAFTMLRKRGKAGMSTHTVRLVFLHHCQHALGHRALVQQARLRSLWGTFVSIDCTYQAGSSLAGSTPTAVTASGRSKCASYRCSVATAVLEPGYVAAVCICPNDSQDWMIAILAALTGAALPADARTPYAERIHEEVLAGGTLGHAIQVLASDNVRKDKNA